MSDSLRILDGTQLALASESSTYDGFEQIVVQGAWKGHWQGEFNINEAMINQMADFGNSSKIATPLDYGHEMIFDNSAPASGWVEPGNFEIRDKGKKASLFARIDFTEAARSKITSRELRYKSPTITWVTKDRKTGRSGGASLHSIALTNTPFLHELPEVRLNSIMAALGNQQVKEIFMNEEQLKALALSFGLPEDSTADQIVAFMDGKEIIGSDDLKALNLKATVADGSQVQLANMKSKLDKIESDEKDRSALSLVRDMQLAGKVLGDETANFKASLAQAKSDPEGFKALMDSIEAFAPKSDPVNPKPNDKGASSELTENVNSALGLSADDYEKYGDK